MAKKRDTFGDSPLGSGGRFAECVREMEKRPDVYDPAGLCASIGRKAYGKKRFAKMAKRGRAQSNPYWLARDHLEQAAKQLARAYRTVKIAQRGVEDAEGPEWRKLGILGDTISAAHQAAWALLDEMGINRNPLTDAEHMRTKKHTMELTDRMERVAMHEGKLGREDLADHWREMAQYVSGAGWAHMRASQGIPFPEPGYAATSGLEGAEWEVLEELRAQAGPEANPCGAGGYGAAANPVKPDGRWHKTQFIDVGEEKGTAYGMRTAKGGATIVPYKPRTFMGSRFAAEIYEDYRSQKIPKGSRFIVIVKGEAKGSPLDPSAHKSLDDAKKAGESALRKLPMPGARSNPAELINAGILAGSAPIPSGIDSPPVSGGILAGSRPIPSGFRDPRLNVGLVDPPLTRRSKPDQPT